MNHHEHRIQKVIPVNSMKDRKAIRYKDGRCVHIDTDTLIKGTDRVLELNNQYKGVIVKKEWRLQHNDSHVNQWHRIAARQDSGRIELVNNWDNMYIKSDIEAPQIDISEGDYIKVRMDSAIEVVYHNEPKT